MFKINRTSRFFFLPCLLIAAQTLHAQQEGLGVGTKTPHPAAMLEVASTNKGLLPPRMTKAQQDAIANPAAGLMVWCTDCGSSGEMRVFNGLSWSNLIGYNDAKSLVFQNNSATYLATSGDVLMEIKRTESYKGILSVPYTGGGYLKYGSQESLSTGIQGLKATVTSGSLSSTGKLEISISGTPSDVGTANFSFKFGSENRTFSIYVYKLKYRVADKWREPDCNECVVLKVWDENDQQKGLLGMTPSSTTSQQYKVFDPKFTWNQATSFVNNLVFYQITNWRLPTVDEMLGVIYAYQNPAVAKPSDYFNTNNGRFWTSSGGRTAGWYWCGRNLEYKDPDLFKDLRTQTHYILPVADFIYNTK